MQLRDYQESAVLKVGEWLQTPSPALFMVSPTGTGKTVCQAEVLRRYPGGIQTAPTEEILDGFRRHGAPEECLWTIKKLKNRLAEAAVDPSEFRYWQTDEAHHSTDNTHKEVDEFLGNLRRVGWSATAFRGTPKETGKLYDWYARNIHEVISLKDAADRGVMQVPEFSVHPLVDDETVSVTNGEFTTSKVTAATKEKLQDLVTLIGDSWRSKATMVALSSVDLVRRFCALAPYATPVTGDTNREDRDRAFRDVQERRTLLVQIAVVSEGVDLPGLRRLVDARPTMSPLFWMQLVGRVTRPGPDRPEVWVCNHNLLRHGYLFEGLIPAPVFTQAMKVWGPDWKPSRRMVSRAVGLDGLGRFAPCQIFTASETFLWFFAIGSMTTQYAVLMRPEEKDPVIVARRDFVVKDGMRDYEARPRWKLMDHIPDMTGCTSVPTNPMSEPQYKWWKQCAKSRGLSENFIPDAKQFQVLPVLLDTNRRLK